MPLVLHVDWAIDCTSVSVVDSAAHTIVGEGRSAHIDFGQESDPESWWSALGVACSRALDGLAPLGLSFDDVGLVMMSDNDPAGGLLAFDSSHSLVHPALVGTHDDSAHDAQWLSEQSSQWSEATGVEPFAGSTVALLSWLHRINPAAWEAVDHVTLPIGYLTERVGGDAALSTVVAMGTGVVDRRQPTEWCYDLLKIVDERADWKAILPVITTAATPVGLISKEAAQHLGIKAAIPIHVGA